MANINYRGNGAWGDGIGRQLTSPEIDSNFYQLNTNAQNKIFNGSAEMGTVGWLSGLVPFTSDNGAIGTYFILEMKSKPIRLHLPVPVRL